MAESKQFIANTNFSKRENKPSRIYDDAKVNEAFETLNLRKNRNGGNLMKGPGGLRKSQQGS